MRSPPEGYEWLECVGGPFDGDLVTVEEGASSVAFSGGRRYVRTPFEDLPVAHHVVHRELNCIIVDVLLYEPLAELTP